MSCSPEFYAKRITAFRSETCPKTGKPHKVRLQGCNGSMDHNDLGGPIFHHVSWRCEDCDEGRCDFSDAKKVGEGWY
jgi:hypothetical protein